MTLCRNYWRTSLRRFRNGPPITGSSRRLDGPLRPSLSRSLHTASAARSLDSLARSPLLRHSLHHLTLPPSLWLIYCSSTSLRNRCIPTLSAIEQWLRVKGGRGRGRGGGPDCAERTGVSAAPVRSVEAGGDTSATIVNHPDTVNPQTQL